MQQVALLVFRMHTVWKYIYKSFCNLTVIKKIPQLEMFAPDWTSILLIHCIYKCSGKFYTCTCTENQLLFARYLFHNHQ